MPDSSQTVLRVWERQQLWSRTASQLKKHIDRARIIGLWLGVLTAVLAVAAVQVDSIFTWAGRGLSAAAAITAGLATIVVRSTETSQVRNWTRARAASEGLKSEVYQRLAGATPYVTDTDPDAVLNDNAQQILDAISDLERETINVVPPRKPVPAVRDIPTYIIRRIDEQVRGYYRPKAAEYQRHVKSLRVTGDALGGLAVVLGAVAAAFDVAEVAAWVPVVTTISGALLAHIAASRFDHLVIEYMRTASELERLRDTRLPNGVPGPEFVDRCEHVISIENQAWMARWKSTDDK